MPTSLRMRSANGVWYDAPERGPLVGHDLPRRDVDDVDTRGGERLGDRDSLVGVDATRRTSRSPRCARSSACVRGHTARTAANTSSGNRSRFVERPAVVVVAPVRQRRDERRQQVTVRAVQFEQVEAGFIAAACGRDELVADLGEFVMRQLARDLVHTGAVRDRRRRDDVPVVGGQRVVDALPHELRRALATGVAELQRRSSPATRRARSR